MNKLDMNQRTLMGMSHPAYLVKPAKTTALRFGFAAISLILPLLISSQASAGCKPEYGEARFEDADGSAELFANQPFVIKRAKDDKTLFRGKIDASGVARWKAGCKGEKLKIQQLPPEE
jgi:hypothetical protein